MYKIICEEMDVERETYSRVEAWKYAKELSENYPEAEVFIEYYTDPEVIASFVGGLEE